MTKNGVKNTWTLVFLLLAGIVAGGFIGEYLGEVSALSWLRFGREFGLTSPLTLDLGILRLQLAFTVNFTVAGILGLFGAIFIYKKMQ